MRVLSWNVWARPPMRSRQLARKVPGVTSDHAPVLQVPPRGMARRFGLEQLKPVSAAPLPASDSAAGRLGERWRGVDGGRPAPRPVALALGRGAEPAGEAGCPGRARRWVPGPRRPLTWRLSCQGVWGRGGAQDEPGFPPVQPGAARRATAAWTFIPVSGVASVYLFN